ncbi:HECT-like ubiquitin-conjugating enzyme-binding-domain-containing protein [Delphinella strobiligena]|nr:HECT-like ubiquitin-conjugating enzyme-binding-domain-containing protein [Delphinella strobiligena]
MRISRDPRNPGQTVVRLSAQEPANFSQAYIDEPIILWTANQLNNAVEVRCRSCNGVIVSSGSIDSWKDLPSEGWAEMMDLWHCHKPDEHHVSGHEHELTSGKGYAAGSKLVAKKGTGFVDAMSLLLKEEDCIGVDVSFRLLSCVLLSICPLSYTPLLISSS